jgi:glycosyltransferase involved in cell wall biosynthesis
MRILHLIPSLSGGGTERQLCLMVPEMAKDGHEVHLAYLREGPESVSLPGVVLHRIALSGNHDPMLFWKLLRLIRTIEPDIIQSRILMMDIAAGFLSFTTNASWVLSEPTSELHYKSFNLKEKLRARLAHRASAIVTNCVGGTSYWLGQGIPNKRLSLIPNVVPLHLINGIEAMPQNSENLKVLICAGRLVMSKSIDIIIKAMKEVIRQQNVLLYIAGEGPARSHLVNLVAQLNLQENVKFLGFLQPRDLWALMKDADAFISMSGYEGMPNCVCEAIACGIPLILSEIPAHRAFLDDDSALLVPVDSVTEVAKAISHALNNTEDSLERAGKALEVIKGWTVEEITAKYIDLYERLIDGKHC